MSGKLNLTNEEQLWLMEKVKKNQLSVSDAQSMASKMSSEKDLKKDSGSIKRNEQDLKKDSGSIKRNEQDLKKDSGSIKRNEQDLKKDSGSIKRNEQDLKKDSGSIKRNEQKEIMTPLYAKSFTFGVVRFPFGFQHGGGINNSMQIDFQKQSIYFMDKITIHIIIPFPDVLGCLSDEDNNGLKLKTKHTKIKFLTNKEHKAEIDRLISMVVQNNQYESTQPVPVAPSFSSRAIEAPMTPDEASDDEIMSFMNQRKLFKEGIIEKKGNASIVWWSKRFLRVEEREFSYYDPNKPAEPLGIIQINTATIIKPSESDKDTFVVTIGKRSYYFRVKKHPNPEKTEEERNSWIAAFREACNPKTFENYWEKMRGSFFYQDAFLPLRSPSPPADYDEADGFRPSQFSCHTRIEMKTFRAKPPRATVPDVSKPDLQCDGAQCESCVPPKATRSTPVPIGPSPSIAPTPPKPTRVAPPAPLPPGPPGPPPPPPMPGLSMKPKVKLMAHCETKLKHFFVPKVVPREMKKTLWAGMTDISPKLDQDLLKKYFATVKKDSNPEPIHEEKKRTMYVSSKKAQNILILMKSNQFLQTVHNLADVITSLQPPEDNEIEIIRRIQKYQPTQDEIELYQKLTDDRIQNQADKIMLSMSLIPCLQQRLELILNIWTFGHQYEEFIGLLKELMATCSEILNSKKFPKVLEYLLAILNLMNTSGTSDAGSATQAFHLKFISQLKNIHNANGFSLVEMLVSQIEKNNPELLDFHKELGTVLQCEKMSVKAIHANIEVLKKDLVSIENNSKTIQSMMKNPTETEKEFFLNIKEFTKKQKRKLEGTVSETDEIQRSFGKILALFGLPKDTFSEELFQYLITFMEEFIDASSAK